MLAENTSHFASIGSPHSSRIDSMLKYISKKVIRRNSGSSKAEEGSKKGTSIPPISFEFNDLNVARFSDLLEVTVRTKLTDQSGDPLSYVNDETTSNLVKEFGDNKVVKADFESYSASTLWSAAIQIINMNERILSSLKCDTLKSATYDDVVALASSLSLPCQKLLGIIFAATEMLIRDEPSCAPMVLNQLANTIVWSLPPSTFVTTNALVNLLVEHRKLFPSCHTFARKISTTYKPVEPEEWRTLAANSVAIYGSNDTDSGAAGAGAAQEQSQKGPLSMELPSAKDSRDSAPVQLQQDAGTKRSTGHNIAPASSSTSNNDTVSAGSKGKAWRSAFTEDLPLNDLNASVSIDVSARLAEQRGTTNNNASDNAGTQRMSSSTADAAASKGNTSRGGIPGGDVKGQQLDTGMTIRQLQEVFGSSLVSAASLDYLSISNIIDEDYADTKTLSGTIKWILHSQELSDLVIKSKQKGANKGIISWADFTALAEPFLVPAELQYLRSNKVSYDTVLAAATSPTSNVDRRAESKHSGEVGNNNTKTRNSVDAGRKDSRSRSRKGFQQDSDSESEHSDGGSGGVVPAAASRTTTITQQAQGRAQNKQQCGASHNKSSTGAGRGSYYDAHAANAVSMNTSVLSDQFSEVDELELQDSNSPNYRHAQRSGTKNTNINGGGGSGEANTSITSLVSNDSSDGGHYVPANTTAKQGNRYGATQANKHNSTNPSYNRNTHSALDLLDESEASIPQMQDRSLSMSEHNSFDDDLDAQSEPGTQDTQKQESSLRTTGPAPSRHIPSSQSQAQQQYTDNSALLANSFDELDSDHGHDHEQARHSATAENTPTLPDADLQSVHSSIQGSVSDLNTTGNTSVNKKGKGKVHKLMKMFHLTSTSTSASVAGSMQGSVHSEVVNAKQGTATGPDSSSPVRSRKDSIESVASALSTSTHNTDASGSGVKKHKSMFGRLKAAVVGSKHNHSAPVDVAASASSAATGDSASGAGESGKMSSLGASVESLPSSADGMQDTPQDSPVSPPSAGIISNTAPYAANPVENNMRFSIGIADTSRPPPTGDRSLPVAGASGADEMAGLDASAARGVSSREVRSDTVSDDGSLASGQSGSTADTLNTGDSTKKKKKSLKGRIAKKFKSVFGSGTSASAPTTAGVVHDEEEGKHAEPDTSAPKLGATAPSSAAMAPHDSAATAAAVATPTVTAPLEVTPPAKPAKKPTFASVVARGIFGPTTKPDDKGAAGPAGTGAVTSAAQLPPPKPAKSTPTMLLQHRPLPANPGDTSSTPSVGANSAPVPATTTVTGTVTASLSLPAAPITAITAGGDVASPPKPRKPALSGVSIPAGGNAVTAHAVTAAQTRQSDIVDAAAATSVGVAGAGDSDAGTSAGIASTVGGGPITGGGREVRSETVSDDGSLASSQSGSTTDTLNTGDSTKKRKSLKGRIAKKFKSVFGGSTSGAGAAGDSAAQTSAGIASTADQHTTVPHHMPAGPSIYQPLPVDAAHTSATSAAAPPQQLQLLVQPPLSDAGHKSTSTPTSSIDVPAPTAAHTPPPSAQSTDSADVITAGRKLSNPALKRSSFKLSSVFSFKNLTGSSKGSNPSSANNSRANSRSSSFSGIENAGVGAGVGVGNVDTSSAPVPVTPTTPIAVSAGSLTTTAPTSAAGPVASSGSRSSYASMDSHQSHQSRDSVQLAAPRNRNGLGLATLLRSTLVPSEAAEGALSPSTVHSPPQSPSKRRRSLQGALSAGAAVRSSASLPAGPVTNATQDRYNALLARSRGMTADLFARLPDVTHHPAPRTVVEDLERIRMSKKGNQRPGSPGKHANQGHAERKELGLHPRASADAQELSRQQELVLEWRFIMQRRAPLSMHMSKEQMAELRAVVTASAASKDRQKDSPGRLSPLEDRAHKQLKMQMSQVADPLFGLSLQGSAQTNRLSRVLQHPGASGGPSEVRMSGPRHSATDQLSPAEIDRVIADNLFHSELDLALGTKYAGDLQRVSARMWRSRYFVLMVEPQVNPNLVCQVPTSALTHTPSTKSMALSVDDAGSQATVSYGYYLLEYSKGVASQWGTVPVKLLKRYAIRNIVSLKTDSRPSKHGLEFTIVFLRAEDPPPVVDSDVPQTGALNHVTHKAMRDIVKQTQPGNKFANVVLQQQHNHKHGAAGGIAAETNNSTASTLASGPASAHHIVVDANSPAAPSGGSETTVGPPSSHPAPINVQEELTVAADGLPVIKTRWNRLFQKSAAASTNRSSAGGETVAAAAGSSGSADATTTTTPAAQAASTSVPPASSATVAGTDSAGSEHDSDEPASDNEEDVASSVADFESQFGEGDYFYRQGTLDGKNTAVVGGKVDRKLYIKLRLKAATADERLQWVQIVNSVASPSMYTNTVSY